MTLERMLTAAVHSLGQGKRRPHCFSAHVPGKGYVNDGTLEADRPEYVRQAMRAAQCEADNFGYARGYAEPGYSPDPPKGIVFANWNRFPSNFTDILDKAGYGIEWSDEWTTCDDCGKAVRTSPDSYVWKPSYDDSTGEVICHKCKESA